MKILLEAPILTNSGYGEHSRLVYDSIVSQNPEADIYISSLPWGTCTYQKPTQEISQCIRKLNILAANSQNIDFDVQIRVGIPNEFEKKAKYSVCVTAGIETDRVDVSWTIKTHQGIDKIIVPSNHSRLGFTKTKYEVTNNSNNTQAIVDCGCPVGVVPYPAKIIDIEGKSLDLDSVDTKFNFLTIAMMGVRKNLFLGIKCFIEQFRDNPDVGLIIKTSSSRSTVIDRINTRKILENSIGNLGDRKCKIYFIHGNMSEEEIHCLYNNPKVKAYYTTTHGEGYGLPIFEAAYSGLPVIATDWSGHLDFMRSDKDKKIKFAKIDFELKEIQKEAIWKDIVPEGSKWAYPKERSIKDQLEKMYKNHGMYKKWAKALQDEILENYSRDKILKMMYDNIFEGIDVGPLQESEEELLIL